MYRRYANEFQHTNLANSGRVAGIGISEDNYSHDASIKSYNHKSNFEHTDHGENGEVIVYKREENK